MKTNLLYFFLLLSFLLNGCGGSSGGSSDNVVLPTGTVFMMEEGGTDPPQTLEYTTANQKVDVFINIDTTGSMGGELDNLKANFSSLVTSLQGEINDVAFGAGNYEDYPTDNYPTVPFGVPGFDQPFRLKQRISTNPATTLTGINAMALGNGGDLPESGWEALFQIATGQGVSVGGANVPAFDSSGTPPAGVEWGTIGGAGFRIGSIPIVVWVTDAANHNSFPFAGAATSANALSALNSIYARVIGVISGTTASTDTYAAATSTNAIVDTTAWDSARPAGCAANECCTGINGGGVVSVAGQCPLVFEIANTGAGLGDAVSTGISKLINSQGMDITAIISDDLTDSVDAVAAFIESVETDTSASSACASGMTVADTNADAINDTFLNVSANKTTCFKINPKINNTVTAQAQTQIFKAVLGYYGDQVTLLHEEDIYFVVPAN